MGKEITLSGIEDLIDKKVRPELALHGGNIIIESLEGSTLSVRLIGECSNCPSAGLTMENIVERGIKEEYPELEIELCTGVSDELIDMARDILSRRQKAAGRQRKEE